MNTNRGTVVRSMRQQDTVDLSIAGVVVGSITIMRIPHDAKARVAFSFDQSVRITHRTEETPCAKI
jgi:ABC-type transporter Mla subunit MlaD